MGNDPVVITGVGLVTSVGNDRESTWNAVRQGRNNVRRLTDLPFVPDGQILGAVVDLGPRHDRRLKVLTMGDMVGDEALRDARLDLDCVDRDRVGCYVASHMGDTRFLEGLAGQSEVTEAEVTEVPDEVPWWDQWLPSTACSRVAERHGLYGPRLSHSTACASGLVEVIAATRAIEDGQCDVALAGAVDAIHPLFAAGFRQMRVLADHEDPAQASRPYDRNRTGFVMGEGAGMFVLERLSHAQRRHAPVYAQVLGGKVLAEAHHVTGLDCENGVLSRLLSDTLDCSRLRRTDVGYINAHGTGTQQNDLTEIRSIRKVFGAASDGICLSSSKSVLGHMLSAAGCVELGITVLAMRDGFAPPTINLTDPDPECAFDCVPLVGRSNRFQNALKISVAFGGHLAALALQRWNGPGGYAYPEPVEMRRAA